MNESVPPPLPSGTRQRGADGQQRAAPPSRGADPIYSLLADKIGGIPNVRKKDNLYQALAIGAFLIVGLIVGAFLGEWPQGVLLADQANPIKAEHHEDESGSQQQVRPDIGRLPPVSWSLTESQRHEEQQL